MSRQQRACPQPTAAQGTWMAHTHTHTQHEGTGGSRTVEVVAYETRAAVVSRRLMKCIHAEHLHLLA
jgi:hypothetical protein